MIWEHLKAFVWLRWRLSANQWRRAGALNGLLMMIVVVAALVTAIPLFLGSFALGQYVIPRAAPVHLMYAWDALIAAFLLFWGVGLLTELQRSESLSLSKFMHLPVSPNGAFLINYVSSLIRLSTLVFVPLMLGFALALVAVKGGIMLFAPLLLAAFLLMITALTYQFQGWLAALMSNPRRRRTVVVMLTLGFILVFQLPNLLNIFAMNGVQQHQVERARVYAAEMEALGRDSKAQKVDIAEYTRRQQEILDNYKRSNEQADRESLAQIERGARLANLVLPIGWLPLGVLNAAEGQVLPSILGLGGMALIGALSLRRAYRTTVGQYQGQATSRRNDRPAPMIATPNANGVRTPGSSLLEARLPGLSEPVSAIALASLRSLVRAPEAKMMLLTPLITGIIFGSSIWNGRQSIPEPFRPLIALGAMGFVLLGLLQLMGNQFGFDRDGFRVFVLCAARRRDILFGKNLAFAPLALGMAGLELLILQVVCPLRLDHLVSMLPQYVSMFLLFCLFANLMSIYAPIFIAAGSLKASNPKLSTGLLQLVMFLILFPLSQAPVLLPLGAEASWKLLGWTAGVPVCLLVSLLECAVVVFLYRLLLDWEGGLFQAREQIILEAVTNRAP